jgi:hypothetical protein
VKQLKSSDKEIQELYEQYLKKEAELKEFRDQIRREMRLQVDQQRYKRSNHKGKKRGV